MRPVSSLEKTPQELMLLVESLKLSQFALSPSIQGKVLYADLDKQPRQFVQARRFEPTSVWKIRGAEHLAGDLSAFAQDLTSSDVVGWLQAATGLGKSTWLLLKLASMLKQTVICVSPFEQLIRFTGAYVRSNKERKGFPSVGVRVHHLPVDLTRITSVNYISATALLVAFLCNRNLFDDAGISVLYVDEAHVDTPEYRVLKIAASSGLFPSVAAVFSTATPDGLPSSETYRRVPVSVTEFGPLDYNADPEVTLAEFDFSRERVSGKVLVFAVDHDHARRLVAYYSKQDVHIGCVTELSTNESLVSELSTFARAIGSKVLVTTFVLETGYTVDVDVVVDFSLKPDVSFDVETKVYSLRVRPTYSFEASQRAGRAGRVGNKAKVYKMKVGAVVDRNYGRLRLFKVFAWLTLMGLKSNLPELVGISEEFVGVTRRKLWNVLNSALPPPLTLQYLDEEGSPYSKYVRSLSNFYPSGWTFDKTSDTVPGYWKRSDFQYRLPGGKKVISLPMDSRNYFIQIMVWMESEVHHEVNPIPAFGGDGLDSDLQTVVPSDFRRSFDLLSVKSDDESYDEEVPRVSTFIPQPNLTRTVSHFRPRNTVYQAMDSYEEAVTPTVPSLPVFGRAPPAPALGLVPDQSGLVVSGPTDTHQRSFSENSILFSSSRLDVTTFRSGGYVVINIRNAQSCFIYPYMDVFADEQPYQELSSVETDVVRSLVRQKLSVSSGSSTKIESWFQSCVKAWNVTVVDNKQYQGQMADSKSTFRVRRVAESKGNSSRRRIQVRQSGAIFSLADLLPLFDAFSVYDLRPCVPRARYHVSGTNPFRRPVEWLNGVMTFRGMTVNRLLASQVDDMGSLAYRMVEGEVLKEIAEVHLVRSRAYVVNMMALGAYYVLDDHIWLLKHVVHGTPVGASDDLMFVGTNRKSLNVRMPRLRSVNLGEVFVVVVVSEVVTPDIEMTYNGVNVRLCGPFRVASRHDGYFSAVGVSQHGLSGSAAIAVADGSLLGLLHGKDGHSNLVEFSSI